MPLLRQNLIRIPGVPGKNGTDRLPNRLITAAFPKERTRYSIVPVGFQIHSAKASSQLASSSATQAGDLDPTPYDDTDIFPVDSFFSR